MKNNNNIEETMNVQEQPKKKRGRPRKHPLPESIAAEQITIDETMSAQEEKPKKKRGRPRKNPLVETGKPPVIIDPDEESSSDDIPSVDDVENVPSFEDTLILDKPLQFSIVGKLSSKDIKALQSDGLEINATISSLRTLCAMYKMQQKNRIAASNQVNAYMRNRSATSLPDSVLAVMKLSVDNMLTIENNYSKVIESVARNLPVCQWLASICGIGYKIAAMLVSEIDMDKVTQPSSISQYMGMNSHNSPIYSVEQINQICKEAGLSPNKPLSKEGLIKVAIMTGRSRSAVLKAESYSDLVKTVRKIPYNKDCKTLLYLVADQFVKQSGPSCPKNEDGSMKSLYGRIYREYKAEFTLINESGGYADKADYELHSKNISSKDLRAQLESGKLSAAHIEMRARRKALSIFVYHFAVAMFLQFKKGQKISRPYVNQYLGHNDFIEPEVPYEDYFDIPEGGIYTDSPRSERVYNASEHIRRFRKDDITFAYVDNELDDIVEKLK